MVNRRGRTAAVVMALACGALVASAQSVSQAASVPAIRVDVPPASHGTAAAAAPVPSAPYVTLLFSRSEVAAADGSPAKRDDRQVATLTTVVAPFLKSRGYVGTGTVQTGTTLQSRVSFTHYSETASISWDGATGLARTYGWTFVSHSATYPMNWTNLSASRIQAETCGSAATIAAHGLPGSAGLYAWPSDRYVDAIQAAYVSTCIAFGRQYSKVPTTQAFALTAPYYQHTKGLNGGSCNDRADACWSVPGIPSHYDLPATIIATIRSLTPGQWYTLQAYLLVTGKSPAYTTNSTRWDCTSSDPREHWTNDNERYCWSDYQAIVRSIPATTVVTDPLTVAHAFGRPGY